MKYHCPMNAAFIGRYVCPGEIISLYQTRLLQLMLAIQTHLRAHDPESYRRRHGRVMYSLRISRSQNTQSRE